MAVDKKKKEKKENTLLTLCQLHLKSFLTQALFTINELAYPVGGILYI